MGYSVKRLTEVDVCYCYRMLVLDRDRPVIKRFVQIGAYTCPKSHYSLLIIHIQILHPMDRRE